MTDFLNVLLLSFSPQGTLSQVSSPGQDESPFFFKPPFEHDRIRPRMLPGYVSDTKKKKKKWQLVLRKVHLSLKAKVILFLKFLHMRAQSVCEWS